MSNKTVSNFCRGTVIGILKAMLGLSASIYIAIYVAFIEPNVQAFLLLLAILPCILAIILAPFINFVPFRQQEPHTKVKNFHHMHSQAKVLYSSWKFLGRMQVGLFLTDNGPLSQKNLLPVWVYLEPFFDEELTFIEFLELKFLSSEMGTCPNWMEIYGTIKY